MLEVTLQDLRFRARQFLIAVVGAGLVFAMTLLLGGLAQGFTTEIAQSVSSLGATSWVVAADSPGRVTALSPVLQAGGAAVARSPGAGRVAPIVIVPQVGTVGGQSHNLVLFGYQVGNLGAPPLVAGHPVSGPGQAVVDQRLNLGVGQHFDVAGRRFTVVGLTTGHTLLGGTPNVYVPLADAQAAVFGGRPLVSAFLTTGTPTTVPRTLSVMSNAQVETASVEGMASVASSIQNSRDFMWIVAAVIVAALIYVTALERVRDFAVLKALGSSSRLLFLGLVVQAVLVSLAAAALAAVLSNFMTGLFEQPIDVPTSAYIGLPVAAVVVGVLASLAALRQAVAVDPAMAFAGG